MVDSVHRNLTGADLHEPKGADSALAGMVYVSDGAGSGAWVPASSVITNLAFSTGDTKLTYKSTADTGWIMPVTLGTIGDSSSGSTVRANADTADLFALFWTNTSNTDCPVFTSAGAVSTRGVSAVADYAAHKRLQLPQITQTSIGIAGGAGGLTTRALGSVVGTETVTLTVAQMPAHAHGGGTGNTTPTASSSVSGGVFGGFTTIPSGTGSTNGPGGVNNIIVTTLVSAHSHVIASEGGGGAHSNMPPTTYMNIMIKL